MLETPSQLPDKALQNSGISENEERTPWLIYAVRVDPL